MPRPKSLIPGKVTVDLAKKAHNCQHVSSHRILRGDRRLKVPNGRSWDHYCVSCALQTIKADMDRLKSLVKDLTESPDLK